LDPRLRLDGVMHVAETGHLGHESGRVTGNFASFSRRKETVEVAGIGRRSEQAGIDF
jgi:hypothetical protein